MVDESARQIATLAPEERQAEPEAPAGARTLLSALTAWWTRAAAEFATHKWRRETILLAAFDAILPLIAAEVWSGFRLGMSDPVLSVIAPSEQPLSVRSLAGEWAIALAVLWFAIGYWRRSLTLWEAALVVVGGAAALIRVGNAWLDALALIVPLARQLALLRVPRQVPQALALLGLVVTVAALWTTRPPALPQGAEVAVIGSAGHSASAFVDWRWASRVQADLGSRTRVFASHGLASEPNDFWIDYVRVAEGHERWAEVLSNRDVDLVVLDAASGERAGADLVRGSADWRVTYDSDGVLVAERAGR
jgi:hypothetical protein